jgi:hypothetical protein
VAPVATVTVALATVIVLVVIRPVGSLRTRRGPGKVDLLGRLVARNLAGVDESRDQLGLLEAIGLDSCG